MTFYCRTSDCLRAYILRYFGEKPEATCDNCGNCLAEGEREDVTETAQKILSCVRRMRERYGVKMVLDVLRGSENERITRLGLDKLTTHGICNDTEKRLRNIVDQLVMREYLRFSDGEYPLLQLGENADELLRGDAVFEIKLVKEAERSPRERKRAALKDMPARAVDRALFDRLVTLRMERARQQNVPAFYVFPDSALVDMCVRLPASQEEFLEVSGVGQVKLERYGEAFLQAIAEYAASSGTGEAPPVTREEPVPVQMEDVMVSGEAVTVSVIADRINVLLMQRGIKKLTGQKLNTWLIEEGYLRVEDGFKVATVLGEELGITTEDREIRGQFCKVCKFGEGAQREIADRVLSELIEPQPE
jgi:ATP-dependent DNA helicase RecQ